MLYREMEKVEWCYKNCGDCTKCNGMKDGKKCGYYPGNNVINELKQWDNDLISAGLDTKYITKIDASSKTNLYFALRVNISSIIPITNISIAPIK